MKVLQVIEMLTKNYDPQDDLVVAWWDIDGFNGRITKEQWSELVEKLDGELDEECWSGTSDFIYGLVDEIEMQNESEQMKPSKLQLVTEDELATARVRLAETILEAENGEQIVTNLHKLTMLYASQAGYYHKNKNKKKAKQWKRVADEMFTITMCAVYRKQDRNQKK